MLCGCHIWHPSKIKASRGAFPGNNLLIFAAMKKNNFAAAAFLMFAVFNAAQTAPTAGNYAAALVFSALAAVALVAASRSKAA